MRGLLFLHSRRIFLSPSFLSSDEANRLFAFIYRIIQFPELARNYGGELYTRYCSPTNPLSLARMGELFTGNLINSPPLSPPLASKKEHSSLLQAHADFHRMNLCSFNRNISRIEVEAGGWKSFYPDTRGWKRKRERINRRN